MLLSITTRLRPATDLGYLLHKHPARSHELELAFGRAHMFYPEATDERCTFTLLLDIDPVGLVRGGGKDGGLLDQYVNDRPYAASSFLSVAIAKTLRTALGGRCEQRPDLVQQPIPLSALVTPLPVRGGADLVERLFGPLGYRIEVETLPLDEARPDWGPSPYITLRLEATCRLADLLNHLYVLIPVLDLKKHYYIDAEEIEKLLAKGGSWLPAHPERDLIARRYLRRRSALAREAIARLAEMDAEAAEAEIEAESTPDADGVVEPARNAAEEKLERPLRLHDQRLDRVTEVLKAAGVRRVVDLGCGSGKLLKRLLAERQFTEILGVDVGIQDLEIAARRLRFDTLSERQRARIKIVQGALTYRDKRIEGFDAAALVEVIEHVDPDRLGSVERAVFEFARPGLVVVTTPNREYNAKFEGMHPGQLRHADHRFEWTRGEFQAWVESVAARYSYEVRVSGIGEEDAALGHPSQMAVFERRAGDDNVG
jgi:3' terminal RNA ribose 2'-O-methyltransferase Hen1